MNWKEDVTLVYDDHTVKVTVKGEYYTDELSTLFSEALRVAEIDYKSVKRVIFFNKNGNRIINLVTVE